MELLSGGEMIMRALKEEGVKMIFGYPGGAVLPIYDELFADEDIRHILVRHEAGAAQMLCDRVSSQLYRDERVRLDPTREAGR